MKEWSMQPLYEETIATHHVKRRGGQSCSAYHVVVVVVVVVESNPLHPITDMITLTKD